MTDKIKRATGGFNINDYERPPFTVANDVRAALSQRGKEYRENQKHGTALLMVIFNKDETQGRTPRYRCSAVAITKNVFLTLKKCLFDEQFKLVQQMAVYKGLDSSTGFFVFTHRASKIPTDHQIMGKVTDLRATGEFALISVDTSLINSIESAPSFTMTPFNLNDFQSAVGGDSQLEVAGYPVNIDGRQFSNRQNSREYLVGNLKFAGFSVDKRVDSSQSLSPQASTFAGGAAGLTGAAVFLRSHDDFDEFNLAKTIKLVGLVNGDSASLIDSTDSANTLGFVPFTAQNIAKIKNLAERMPIPRN